MLAERQQPGLGGRDLECRRDDLGARDLLLSGTGAGIYLPVDRDHADVLEDGSGEHALGVGVAAHPRGQDHVHPVARIDQPRVARTGAEADGGGPGSGGERGCEEAPLAGRDQRGAGQRPAREDRLAHGVAP